MIAPSRRSSPLTILAVIAAAGTLAMTVGARTAWSAPYTPCSLSSGEQDPPGDKPTYNLSLKRQNTTCTTAKKVMNAFHRCRSKSGYRCTKVLTRWSCNGRKDSSIDVEFYGTFTCRSGSRRVKSSYQQKT